MLILLIANFSAILFFGIKTESSVELSAFADTIITIIEIINLVLIIIMADLVLEQLDDQWLEGRQEK